MIFFSIPKNENLRTKWFINIGREVSKNSGVCSQHFESKFIQYKFYGDKVKRFLTPEAVPILLLTQFERYALYVYALSPHVNNCTYMILNLL